MNGATFLQKETGIGQESSTAATRGRPWIFITWYPYCRRSDAIAEQIGARSYLVHYLRFKVPYLAPLKYILQCIKTLWILFRNRPSLVLVASPPVFAPLLIWLLSKPLRYVFVIDAHSGVFQHRRWKWALPIQRFLARRALLTIVTNDHMQDIVRSWKSNVAKIQDLSLNLDPQGKASRRPGFHVVFICTFSGDEPVEEVARAGRLLADVSFTFTGDPYYAPANFRATLASNVRLTGFMPDAEYLALLRGADAILVLTLEDHTMQRGAYEAMSLEKPLITSHWPLLKRTFSRGTIHVDNTAEGIASAVRQIQADPGRWREEMVGLKRERRSVSEAQVDTLRRICRSADPFRKVR
jgi:glycosyltransferase involved in cell wall biosynthesis